MTGWGNFTGEPGSDKWADYIARLISPIVPGGPALRFAPQMCAWLEMFEKLDAENLDEAYDIFTFGYDSDLPIATNVETLNAIIESFEGDPKITLVGHSMGGLVSNSYLHKYGGEKINHLITIGTPYRGSAALQCSNTSCSRVFPLFDEDTIDIAAILALSSPQARAAYNTLKSVIKAAINDDGTKNLAWDNPYLSSFNDEANYSYENYTAAYGDIADSGGTVMLAVMAEILEHVKGHDSDGIVPVQSARLGSVRQSGNDSGAKVADNIALGALDHGEIKTASPALGKIVQKLKELAPPVDEEPTENRPNITGIVPSPVPASSEPQTLTIRGENFESNRRIIMTNADGDAVFVNESEFISSNELKITVTVGTQPGERSLTVTNLDSGLSSEPFVFSVIDNSTELSDLIIQNLTVVPSSAQPGDSITVSFDIFNQGAGAAAASITNIRITESASAVTTSDPLLASVSTPSLAAGESFEVNKAVTVPSDLQEGSYYIWVIADVNRTAGQDNENNDRAKIVFTVSETPAVQPAITGIRPNPVVGSSERQTVSILGANFVSGASVTLHAQSDGVDYDIPAERTTFVSATQIDVSANFTVEPDTWTAQVTNPDGQSSNEFEFQVTAPDAPAQADLVIQNLTVSPTTAQAGDSVTVSFDILNQGTGVATASTTNIRISSSPDTVTTSDPLLTNMSTPSIAAGASFEVRETVTIPSDLADGTYYIWVIADVDSTAGQGSENEANDKVNEPVTIGAASACADPNQVVSIPNSNLEEEIREELGKPSGDITCTDMESLTGRLRAPHSNISSLEGLQYAVNLTGLDFDTNQISDLTPLSNLTNLTDLNLNINQISDITALVSNSGLVGDGDSVGLYGNCLDLSSGSEDLEDINTLLDRGVTVYYEPQDTCSY